MANNVKSINLSVEINLAPKNIFWYLFPNPNFAPGEMAERSNAAVLKTVDCQRSGGSNPSLSAEGID